MQCASCGTENAAGKKFCVECGASLARACERCGAPLGPAEKFCGECGAAVAAAGQPHRAPPAPPAAAPEPATERRLVSILFADLVGFTPLAESRDAEEVRELLSRYFDTCRRLIDVYGGTVEKFIGDAVMAVWGTPVATEDDAERAVRAALDLVAAVAALGREVGAESLRARAGVLTGEAAVNLAAVGEGMVAGDLVNTASRVQSVAEPGTVLVGEATRRATQRAIAYEEAGAFQLKGKEGETPLWRALRVVSGRGGELRSQGLEAPFVGRERELRQIKELFHVCADERRAQLVSVTGVAGTGKSRLSWEFYKYFDGIADTVYWHRGRCLAYGDGVTYWALADMVRMRCRIAEDEQAETALPKLQAVLEEHILDPDERAYVEPRLAQLVGLAGHEPRERRDLFAAWRLFFERLAETYPTVLAFEDMQWADASLLDFIEHLLEWSRNYPLYVIALARPELLERRPTWGAGLRNFTSLYLEPLPRDAMEAVLDGLVPGLPESLREQILARAEGVPLYAVETVRMLLDRGLVVEDGPAYRVVGEVASLDVPETLQALVAARLDGLSPDERRLLQDASVLGKTFTSAALAALAGREAHEIEPALTSFVRKELLNVQLDPRSPEHGQFGFLQDIVRRVAYETLPRRERRAKHLAAAEHLASTHGEDEVAEVVASHLVEAYRLEPDADDAAVLRMRAFSAMLRAGERAASLGAALEAKRYFVQAAELAAGPEERAQALARAGETALQGGDLVAAEALLEQASELHEQVGDVHAAARVAVNLAEIDATLGRVEESLDRMERAYARVSDDEADADVAYLLAGLGTAHFFAGHRDRAAEFTERALDVAEALKLPDVLCRGWNTKALLVAPRRPQEANALYRLVLDTATAHQLDERAAMTCGNLSDSCFREDDYTESLVYLQRSLDLARRKGDRFAEWFALSELSYALTMLGRWDEAVARLAEVPEEQLGSNTLLGSPLNGVLEIHVHRGDVAAARRLLARYDELARSGDVQLETCYLSALAAVRLADGDLGGALAAAERAVDAEETFGLAFQGIKQALVHALEAAARLGDRDEIETLLRRIERLPPGLRPPFLAANVHRFRARLAGDDAGADGELDAAASALGDLGFPFHLAVVQLEHAEWLARHERPGEAEPLVAEAEATFEALRASPWAERAAALGRVVARAGLPA